MANPSTLQNLLFAKLAEHQARNPSYSLRAFARKLGLSPGMVSMILSGRRGVSVQQAGKLCDALMLDPKQRQEVLASVSDRTHYRNQRKRPDPSGQAGVIAPNYLELGADRFALMSEWYYFGILSLIKIPGFSREPKWIARRLGIPAQTARVALERLKRLGLLVEAEDGTLSRSSPRYTTTDDVADLPLRKSHFQCLELARASLENDALESRDFTHFTLPMDPKLMPEAKRMIRQFQDALDARLEELGAKPSEVYRLCIQLFPLTRSESPKRRAL